MSESGQVRGLTIVEAIGAVLRYRRLTVAVALATAALTAAYVLSSPRTYTSIGTFTPTTSRQIGAFGGLAAQLGVAIPGTEGNQSPAFYADLLDSRTLLDPLVRQSVEFTWNGQRFQGTYVELAGIKGVDSVRRHEAAIRKLRKDMSVGFAPRTGIVRIDTKSRYAPLSATLTVRALDLLNKFNVDTRRSQGAAQRQFLEQRLQVVTRELREAEDAVRVFAQRNRGDPMNSPELRITQDRLERDVMMRTQVQSTLMQAFEQAKLDEIRDTPLITVIEQPVAPVDPDARGLITKTIIGGFVGLILGMVAALLMHAVRANRRDRPETFTELYAELEAAKSDLLRMFLLGRGQRSNGASETKRAAATRDSAASGKP